MTLPSDAFEDALVSVFPALAARAVKEVLRRQDAADFLAWMCGEAPEEFPELFGLLDLESGRRAFALNVGLALWNSTPLPQNGFRPQPLEKPGRNLPCPCGSGKKYKKCCSGPPPFPPLEPEMMWFLLVQETPIEDLEEMRGTRSLPASALALVGRRLLEAEDAERAVCFLEPTFEHHPEKLDGRYESALETLLEAYDQVGDLRRKSSQIKALMSKLRPPLLGVLWNHLCIEAIEKDETEIAREYFKRAQDVAPEDPNLSLLEVTLLSTEGEFQQTSDRAGFWLAKLRQQGLDDDEPLMVFLAQAHEDPLGTLLENDETASDEQLGRLRALLDQMAERDISNYEFVTLEGEEEEALLAGIPGDGPLIRLSPAEELLRLEEAWEALWELNEREEGALAAGDAEDGWNDDDGDDGVWDDDHSADDLWDEEDESRVFRWLDAESWLSFLENHPAAFDSLSILADLSHTVAELQIPSRALVRGLVLPIVLRGVAILEASLTTQADGRLPWAEEVNRPALYLVDHQIEILHHLGDREAGRRLAERLLTLAPDDHFGYCVGLVNGYLRSGEDERALNLAERFQENSSVALPYGRILALYRLGREAEARRLATTFYATHPLVADNLVGRRSDEPEDPFAIDLDETEEAWWYGQVMGESWQESPGVLAWLEQTTREAAGHDGKPEAEKTP